MCALLCMCIYTNLCMCSYKEQYYVRRSGIEYSWASSPVQCARNVSVFCPRLLCLVRTSAIVMSLEQVIYIICCIVLLCLCGDEFNLWDCDCVCCCCCLSRMVRKPAGRTIVSFPDLDFADDVALLAELLELLVPSLEVMASEAASLGLELNWQKTKVQDALVLHG